MRRSNRARSAARGRSIACFPRRRFSSREPDGTSPTTRRKANRVAPRERRRRVTPPSQILRKPTARRLSPKLQRATRPRDHLPRRSRKTEHLVEVLAERLRKIRPTHREVDERLQEAQFVARIVSNAVNLVGVNRP